MGLFTVLSKKEQVAEAVKRRIREGKIPAGTRLESVRALADAFKVSVKVVMDAFDLLETEKFILREPGRGVFVRGRGSKALEVGVLGFGVGIDSNDYFRQLAAIASPPNLREGFNFLVRAVSTSGDLSDEAFADELRRFRGAMNADGLLINAPNIGRKRVELCLKQRIPTIFVGDFSEGSYPEIEYHQITGDSRAAGRLAMRRLLDTERTAAVTLFSGSLERYFFREFYEGAKEAATEAGIALHLLEFPKGISSTIPEPERGAIYHDKIRAASLAGHLDCPALNGGLPEGRLLQAFAELGTRPPALYHDETSPKHQRQFYDAIHHKIQEVLAEPKRFRKTVICPESVMLRRSI